jgi:two-component system cell cycle sensor histidine kinase/response regulator CckA
MLNATDTGMPPGIVHQVFEPSFTTKESGNGTGPGLSAVLGMVRGHGEEQLPRALADVLRN